MLSKFPRTRFAALDVGLCCALFTAAALMCLRGFVISFTDVGLWDMAAGLVDHIPEIVPTPHYTPYFLGIHWPLALTPYHGPWALYPLMALIPLLGPHAVAAYNIFFGCLAIAGTYALAIALYGSRAAAFAAALLVALNASFVVLGGMTGLGDGIATVAACVWTCVFLLRFADERRDADAILSALCLGFALGGFAWSLAFSTGLAAFGLYAWRTIKDFLAQDTRRRLTLLAACAALSAFFLAPLALYNIHTHGFSGDYIGRIVSPPDEDAPLLLAPVHRDYAQDFAIRLVQLARLLDGTGTDYQMFVTDGFRGGIYLKASLLAAALIAFILPRRRGRARTRWMLPWILATVYFALSPWSPSGFYVHHLLPILPFLSILIASTIALSRSRIARVIMMAATIACVLLGLRAIPAAARQVVSDNEPFDTPILPQVCSFLMNGRSRHIVSLRPFFSYALDYCSQGRIAGTDVSWREVFTGQSTISTLREGSLILESLPDSLPFLLFLRPILVQHHWRAVETKEFKTRQGRVQFRLLELRGARHSHLGQN